MRCGGALQPAQLVRPLIRRMGRKSRHHRVMTALRKILRQISQGNLLQLNAQAVRYLLHATELMQRTGVHAHTGIPQQMQSGQGGNSGRSATHNRGRILEWLRFQTGVAQRVHNANHVRVIAQHLLTARIHRIHRTGHAGSLTQLIAILNDRGLQRHRHRQARNIRGVLRTVRVAHPAHNLRQIIGQSIAAIITQILLTQKVIRGTMQRRRQRMRNRVPQHVGAAKIRGLTVRFSLHR